MSHKALLVAVNQYRHSSVTPLPNTARDVEEIERIFVEPPTQFVSTDVEVFSNASARLATIRPALQRFFAAAQPDDVLLLYWAGHGALVGDEGYLTPMDVDPGNIAGSSIGMVEVRALIEQSPAKSIMACFDTCHSGAIARGVSTMRGLEVHGHGRVVIAACTHEQSAWDDPRLGHGVFTYHLIEGLRGGAANSNGDVSVLGLYEYVCAQLQGQPNQQTPVLKCTLTGPVVLRTVSGRSGLAAVPPATQSPPPLQTINSSGSWCWLGQSVFEASEIQELGAGHYRIAVDEPAVELERALRDLAQGHERTGKPFAFRNQAELVRVTDFQSRLVSGRSKFLIEVRRAEGWPPSSMMEISWGGSGRHLSAEDIAELRARRILFGKRATQGQLWGDRLVESFIQGSYETLPVNDSPLPALVAALQRGDIAWGGVRVTLLGHLILSWAVERVERLDLDTDGDQLKEIHFIGVRARKYENVPPHRMEFRGGTPFAMP